MTSWNIRRTNPFLKDIKKHKKNHELLLELDNKIVKLKKEPFSIGGELSGRLCGKRSTRLLGKFRLIFQINDEESTVYLMAIDHRGNIY